jgi:hypothetical protein
MSLTAAVRRELRRAASLRAGGGTLFAEWGIISADLARQPPFARSN